MRSFLIALLVTLPCAARAAKVTVPVDVGVGPAVLVFPSPVFSQQPAFPALKISVEAIIDQALIRKEKSRIPAQYRKMAEQTSEVRFSPSIFIPDELILSPRIQATGKVGSVGIFGITWRPIALGVPFITGQVRTSLDAGLVLTALYLYGDALPDTFFLRPGIDLRLESEMMATDTFGLSAGLEAAAYLPQELGSFFQITPIDGALWGIGQVFVKLHYRFPYEANL